MNNADVFTAFTMAHGEFFEPLGHREAAGDFADVLREVLPAGWGFQRHDVWLAAGRPRQEPTPEHGFKIHVSTIPHDALRTLRAVAAECVALDIDFKVAADPFFLFLMNGKRYNRGGAGKFMAIYPRSEAQFIEAIERLYQATQPLGLRGPYILSDRRYRDSPILYWRYGGFRSRTRLRSDGSSEHVILGPGGEAIPDDRLPYFQLPSWVSDPFGGGSGITPPSSPVLRDRYEIQGVFTYSNTGGVYHGVDRDTGRRVVIKEGRPYTGFWGLGTDYVDAPQLLAREHELLTLLAPTRAVPEPVELLQAWEHTFLVQELVEGVTLQAFWASASNIMAPFIHRPGRVGRFVPTFARLGLALLDAVERIHARGVLLGDVSSTNVFVEDPEALTVRFIDLESALRPSEDARLISFASRWATPGFTRSERESNATLTPEDDLFGIAMLMYGAIAPVQALSSLDPDARWRILENFIRLGLPEGVMHAIRTLAGGDTDGARAHLRALLHQTTC